MNQHDPHNKHKKKQKHNYTSELELKSLLIRVKNERQGTGSQKRNAQINRYVKIHTKLGTMKYGTVEERKKRDALRKKLSSRIVQLSEMTCVDPLSYERFGDIILLMIKNILRKPQFSGYTFRDDFYSDAVYKILKYLHNFDHTKISDRSGQAVNAFAYISQYIHNSIIYVINTKKKDQDRLTDQVRSANIAHDVHMHNSELIDSKAWREEHVVPVTQEVRVDLEGSVLEGVAAYFSENDVPSDLHLVFTYPKELSISLEEFDGLARYLNGSVSIQRRA